MNATTKNKNVSDDQLEKTKTVLILLGSLGLALTLVAYVFYYSYFQDYDVSNKTELWGQFGDFIGGVLNPFVGLLALFGLLWTIYQNQRELSLSRESLGKSADALEQNNLIAGQESRSRETSERKEDLYRMIDMLHREIVRNLSITISAASMEIGKVVKVDILRYQMLGGVDLRGKEEKMIETIILYIDDKNVNDAKNLLKDYWDVLNSISRDLKQLKSYLSLYEKETQNNIVTSYYKSRFVNVVKGLKILKFWLDDKVLEYYEEEGMPENIR